MTWTDLADKSLREGSISREEALSVLNSTDAELLEVLAAAFRVRSHFHGNKVRVHVLQNAKSGVCPEDCSFCSQAAQYHSPVPQYGIQTVEELVEGARKAHEMGAVTYCMVTSTRGPSAKEVERICEATRIIKSETPLKVCASLGLLLGDQASTLRSAGVDRYNHNLETSEEFYPSVCTSHTFQDRLNTIRSAKAAGMEACAGGIVGMGETPEDRVELALSLRELEVESVPVNFLNARPNTPFEKVPQLSPTDCLRSLAMFRFTNPSADVRAAGGREICLSHLQPFALYPANSIFTNGYLTTPGQEPSADWEMIVQAGFVPVVAGAEGAPATQEKLLID
ncbi:MAG: biotin synthase BioB [Candidatus Omnitrophica bacterium]|nr:biotin synthase BioB [Candidatus Omnitrophota bacterium]